MLRAQIGNEYGLPSALRAGADNPRGPQVRLLPNELPFSRAAQCAFERANAPVIEVEQVAGLVE
jgi:hypothetical protein